MVQQRIALAGAPVAGDSHARSLAADEEFDEVVTRRSDLPGKPVMALYRVQPSGGFIRQHTRDRGRGFHGRRSRR
jgi:hypothetical protein